MSRIAAPRLLLGLGLAALTAGCTGGEEPGPGDPPTIALLAPEGIVRVRENLAVAGTATGDLERVTVQVDTEAPAEATGLEEWFHLVDVRGLADGSHTVQAIAEDTEGRTAESLRVSFTSTANQPPNTSIWSGFVRNPEQQLLPGVGVSVHGTTRSTFTDANGRYAVVGLPRDQEALLVAGAPGYVDTYMPRFLASGDAELNIPLLDEASLDFVAGQYGVVRQNGLGTLIGTILAPAPSEGGYAGATVALDGLVGEGPFYTTPAGDFDPSLTETTASGAFIFFNVTPGEAAVVASDGTVEFIVLGSVVSPDDLTLLFGRAL